MKYLSWIILLPLALVLILFGVNNRGTVPIDLWPAPFIIDIPLFALLFGALLIGVVWGGIAAWMNAGRVRRDARQANRDLRSLSLEEMRQKKEIESLKAELKARDAQAAQGLQTNASNDGGEVLKIESSAR